ncbi:hypothetical protein [Bdellovibrio bacteriovorus]|uniref:Lipoprotein n=1 Tax=Bdellovibrio bacteriovorus TaxID=959 RepID=A0A150WGM7_BDEBC|nr:hypothetical protein [Bdellovibrio bacteriovorus]KYG62103.1 hypothetical protein AZI85_07855 [Bdellovibrio bacteriovorus]
MQIHKSAALLATLSLALVLTGCEGEQTEKDMIAEAQFCLDKATDEASAMACTSKISGLTSPRAYALRCAAGFIAAEVTDPANLSSALNAIQDNQGTTALLSALTFPRQDLMNDTFAACNASGQDGLALIGAMAKSATLLSNLSGGAFGSCTSISDCDSAQIESTINNLIAGLTSGDPTEEAEAAEAITQVTEVVQTVYATTCGGTQTANDDICGQINTALGQAGVDIATTDPAEIVELGKKLLEQWTQ